MRRTAFLMVLVLVSSCSRGREATDEGKSESRAVVVDARSAERLEVERTLEAIGSIEASERVAVSSEIAGRIESYHFEEGQHVSMQGTEPPLLFRFDSDLLELQVKNAEAQLALASAEVAEKKTVYERKKKIWEQNAAPEASYIDARLAYEKMLASRSLAEAALEIARERLTKAVVRAPFAGTLGEREVGPGDYVKAGEELVEIVQTDPVHVSFSIPERHRPLLREGLKVLVTTEAFEDRTFEGTVFYVAPGADQQTRSIRLKAKMPNPDGALKPGLFAQVRLVVGEGIESLVVPEESVVPRGDRFYLYVVDDSSGDGEAAAALARRREVRLGQRLVGKVVIDEGLSGEEVVITSGLQKVSDGFPVRVREGG